MDQEELFVRERTYYDEYPDYTRPALEMPRGFRERVLGRLEFLYSPETAVNWMPELERILKVHHAHKPPEMIEKEQEYDPEQRFCQEHIMLITYGDMVKWDGPTPLSVLHRFVTQYAGGGINTLHLLPFFPYSSDRGFAVIDYRRVDEWLGSWKAVPPVQPREGTDPGSAAGEVFPPPRRTEGLAPFAPRVRPPSNSPGGG